MKKLLLAFCCALFSLTVSAQAYRSLNIIEPSYITYETHKGIEVDSITPQNNGSYIVKLYNSNRNLQDERATYSFYWYLSYKGKRVSDYYKSALSCQKVEKKTAWAWPNEVPKGYERYVTVQLGKEPKVKDYRNNRDDD